MGGNESAIRNAKTLGSMWVAQVLRLSIDALVGFHASVSGCNVDH